MRANPREPMVRLADAHRQQLVLCDRLEAIADSLPGTVDREVCGYVAQTLGPMMRDLHAVEENIVFTWIEQQSGNDPTVRDTLEHLKCEHCEDQCFAEELTEMLRYLAVGESPVKADTAGYMLRGFFTSLRRHVRLEQACVRGILARYPIGARGYQ